MVHNGRTLVISVDPVTFEVVVDGKQLIPVIQWIPFRCPKSIFFFNRKITRLPFLKTLWYYIR
jgi:hypothetical protein